MGWGITRIALAVALTACSGGVPIEGLVAARTDAWCTYYLRCGFFPDMAACKSFSERPLTREELTLIDAVREGDVSYDGEAEQRCIDAIATQTCDTTDEDGRWSVIEACNTDRYTYEPALMRGTKGEGEPCRLSAECISQACSGGNESACVSGTCLAERPRMQAWAEIGERCKTLEPCARGVLCECGGGGWCDQGTCVPLKAAGEPCSSGDECGYGLECIGYDSAICKPLPLLGEPCPDGQCRDAGQYCSDTTGTCTPVGVAGAACTSYEQCSGAYPCSVTPEGTVCAPPTLIGQRCGEFAECFEARAYCVIDPATAIGICMLHKSDGEACEDGHECMSGHCEGITPRICAPRQACM